VTLGGALANDVHGKNHHVAGTFGRYVTQFEMMRSDGTRLLCSPTENADYFAATIGGLGLTGFIVWVEISLKKVENSAVDVENIKYNSLSEFFTLSEESADDYEYTVAWVDCLAKGEQTGRGHFTRANHTKAGIKPKKSKVSLSVPIDPPLSLINSLTLKVFNSLYYNRQKEQRVCSTQHYDPFFYPLDAIKNWNRVYGPKGFLQFQCVVPPEHGEAAIREILDRIAAANRGSFLAVLKLFGDVPSPGLLSFPRPGATLALDFPYEGDKTLALLSS
ncbi:MAG: FAD-binding oxidoreductase, partial [Flavobacteriales bacterium]|nr:FAD-binding oxidoreductase [Flavobacteriales bacterium]